MQSRCFRETISARIGKLAVMPHCWIMEIVNERTHRVLAYVDALNRHGIKPTQMLVEEFASNPNRKTKRTGGMGGISLSDSMLRMLGEREIATEAFTEYLERLGWVSCVSDRVELSGTGRSLLKALNSPIIEDSSTDVFEVVLDPENPFAYIQALGGMSSVEDALLIDPYFRVQQLMDVAELENIKRVLLGENLKSQDYVLLGQALLALKDDGRNIEIRKTANLHDRYLIPSEGNVLMLGSSLGGIGKKVSTITTLGGLASGAIRDAHDPLWERAVPVKAKERPNVEIENGKPSAPRSPKKDT